MNLRCFISPIKFEDDVIYRILSRIFNQFIQQYNYDKNSNLTGVILRIM